MENKKSAQSEPGQVTQSQLAGWDVRCQGGIYRAVLAERDASRFQKYLAGLGHGRNVSAHLWERIRSTMCGTMELPPPLGLADREFLSNDANATREPLGRLTIHWRRLRNTRDSIDLQFCNHPHEV